MHELFANVPNDMYALMVGLPLIMAAAAIGVGWKARQAALALQMLRPDDRCAFCELQPEEAEMCDDRQFGGKTCTSEVPGSSGDLACDEFCQIDISGCEEAFCGDGKVNTPEEACDNGKANSNTAECTTYCQEATCGDGYVWEGVETCDDGNDKNTDACPETCQPNTCGDGYQFDKNGDGTVDPDDGDEECDEGLENGTMCPAICAVKTCNIIGGCNVVGDDQEGEQQDYLPQSGLPEYAMSYSDPGESAESPMPYFSLSSAPN